MCKETREAVRLWSSRTYSRQGTRIASPAFVESLQPIPSLSNSNQTLEIPLFWVKDTWGNWVLDGKRTAVGSIPSAMTVNVDSRASLLEAESRRWPIQPARKPASRSPARSRLTTRPFQATMLRYLDLGRASRSFLIC